MSTFKVTLKLLCACPRQFIFGPNFVKKMAVTKIILILISEQAIPNRLDNY